MDGCAAGKEDGEVEVEGGRQIPGWNGEERVHSATTSNATARGTSNLK